MKMMLNALTEMIVVVRCVALDLRYLCDLSRRRAAAIGQHCAGRDNNEQ